MKFLAGVTYPTERCHACRGGGWVPGAIPPVLLVLSLLPGMSVPAAAQGSEAAAEWESGRRRFASYEGLPTFAGVVSGWEGDAPVVHLYDTTAFRGHGDFVSRGLRTGLTFKQFKTAVRDPERRRFLPFFLYDLRRANARVDGAIRTWAVRLEDYEYPDDPRRMEAETRRLVRLLAHELGDAKGVVIPVRLDDAGLAALAADGFPSLTLTRVARLRGAGDAAPVARAGIGTVLNPGVGVGRLRYVRAGEAPPFARTDLVVFEKLPARVPPIAGFVTLEPQTPLSHVNLLARNRGTVNVHVASLDVLPGARERIGTAVRLEAHADGRITLAGASEAEVAAFAEKRLVATVPKADLSHRAPFAMRGAPPEALLSTVIGAKAANYALIRRELPEYVRPGLAIPFAHYFEVLERSGARRLVDRLLAAGEVPRETRDAALAEIRRRIESSTPDLDLVRDVRSLIERELPDRRIRLRSSTNCEDLPGFNGAGLYLSKGVDPWEDDRKVARKLLAVYASVWTPLAFEEREYFGLDHREVGMAVLVNESFEEAANGVAVTIPGPEGPAVVVNSQPGNTSVTNPEGSEIPEAIVFPVASSDELTVESRSSLGDVYLAPGMRPELLELRRVMLRLHDLIGARAGVGVDVEFKRMGGARPHLYVKQARPLGVVLPE